MSKNRNKRYNFTRKSPPAEIAGSGYESENLQNVNTESVVVSEMISSTTAEDKKNYADLTNVELARLIVENAWSSRAESTLNRLSKDELIFICKNKSDESLERVSKANVESANDIITACIDLLDEAHKARNGELNKESIKKFTQKQSTALAPMLNQLAYTNFGLIAMCIGLGLLAADSFYGFEKMGFFKKNKVIVNEKK